MTLNGYRPIGSTGESPALEVATASRFAGSAPVAPTMAAISLADDGPTRSLAAISSINSVMPGLGIMVDIVV